MARPDVPQDEGDPLPEGPSKTRRKHEMHELQALGEALVALDARRLAELDLPERLADAVLLAKDITKHEGRRRQMQFIGRLMRDVDAAPIRARLERWAEMPRAEKARFAALERWRDRLLVEDDALDAYLAEHPQVERKPLAAHVAAARAERSKGGPPRKFRELFRYLKSLDPPSPLVPVEDVE
jgi:ribosome-associated protein